MADGLVLQVDSPIANTGLGLAPLRRGNYISLMGVNDCSKNVQYSLDSMSLAEC